MIRVMKKIHRRTTGIIILAALATASLIAQPAQFQGLELSEEQKEQLEALRLEHHKEMKPLRNQMAELRLKKKHLMSEDDTDLGEVFSVIDEQTILSNKMQKMQAENRLEIKAVFTDEQLMKLEQRRRFASHRSGRGRPGNLHNKGRQFYGESHPGRGNPGERIR